MNNKRIGKESLWIGRIPNELFPAMGTQRRYAQNTSFGEKNQAVKNSRNLNKTNLS